jgi:hypothetical protein
MKRILIYILMQVSLLQLATGQSFIRQTGEEARTMNNKFSKPLINEDGLIVGQYETFDSNGTFHYRISYKENTVIIPALAHFFFSEKNQTITQIGNEFHRHVQNTAVIQQYNLQGKLLYQSEHMYQGPYIANTCADGSFLMAARKHSPDSTLYLIKFSGSLQILWEQSFENLYPQNVCSSPDQSYIVFAAYNFTTYSNRTILLNKDGRVLQNFEDMNTVNTIQFHDSKTVILGGGDQVKVYSISEDKMLTVNKINIPLNVATDFAISISSDGKYIAVAHCREGGAIGIDVSVYEFATMKKIETIAVSDDRSYKRYRIHQFLEGNRFFIYTPKSVKRYEYAK